MAVPDTNTFSMQDIQTTTGSSNLSAAFAGANPVLFDPAYNNDSYAPANSMKRFRNYAGELSSYATLNSLTIDSIDRRLNYSITISNGGIASRTYRLELENVTQYPGIIDVSSLLTVPMRSTVTFTGYVTMDDTNFTGDLINVAVYCNTTTSYLTTTPSSVNLPY